MPQKNLKICFCKLCKGKVVLSRNIVTRHIQTYGTFDGFSTENIVESENTFQQEENAGQASVFSSPALFSSQEDSDTLEPLVSGIFVMLFLHSVLHPFLFLTL